ncbi:AAA family ATPase [Pseudoflavitalea sp. G-6-1-2]|uniref:AAA family ATPase n=1 Tax=Pseudoflavitalea sp. G-6-1-2 TaxID=2728841 RepID=UPI00146C9CE3|nr:AAA family ATPase [Pseudoflavitalea sp. G-6-1-2]NML19552.1 AAA family ATPase [Pseudoflavitalea sp. G-6-1-2]
MSSSITKSNFIVITGGPGMGKTSLIRHLIQLGYSCVEESGRSIIQQQVAEGKDALPWKNRMAFAQLMFNRSLEDFFQRITQSAPVFFDRGIPDIIGYLELCELPVPADIMETALRNRYHKDVFVTPPWQQIYVQDEERKQDAEEAIRTYEKMMEVYSRLGYKLIEIPKLPVSDRVCFMLDHLHDVL